MPEYQLQIKQVVDYPRCRIYREFIHKLINDRSIRINGGSGLFHFTCRRWGMGASGFRLYHCGTTAHHRRTG